jgi:histidinol-phosphate aminotransferase
LQPHPPVYDSRPPMDKLSFFQAHVVRLSGYVPGEQPRDRLYVKLNTNESPYAPSPVVLEALRGAVTDALRLYPDPTATALRAKASAVYGVPADHILVGNGSDELLSLVMRACIGPGDRVAYAAPTYSLYATLVALQNGVAIEVPFDDTYALPTARLSVLGQRVTFVCNPNAPSGTLVPLPAIEELARTAPGLLVVDEAYVDYASAGATALPLVGRHPNVVVLRTFSKSFSLCGMRVGLAFGVPPVLTELAKVKDSYNVSHLGQVAAAAALDDCAWMAANVARVVATRAELTAALHARGFDVAPSDANFVLARRPGKAGEMADLQRALRDRGVLVRYFDVPRLRDALRITVGTPDETAILIRAIDAARGAG